MDNQYLSFAKSQFTVTTAPVFLNWKPFTITCRNRPGLLALMLKRSGYQSRTAFFALLDGTGQIGFAHLVTDYDTFGYLCDV